MKLRRYCVTVMDHWTPLRCKTWDEVQRVWLRNIHDR